MNTSRTFNDVGVNLFGGSPLNRLSWLRPSHAFLNAVITSSSTRWILFNAGQPLIASSSTTATGSSKPTTKLAYLPTSSVLPFLGPSPYFGQGASPGELIPSPDESSSSASAAEKSHHEREPPTAAARHHNSPIVFLGLHESHEVGGDEALPTSDFKDPEVAVAKLRGTPYFSLDVADLEWEEDKVAEVIKNAEEAAIAKDGEGEGVGGLRGLNWVEPRSLMASLDAFTGGVFAEARSMVDWNQRNKFCPACGAKNYSMWGGWKLACSTLLPWANNSGRKPCPTVKGLHNFTHPRTDAVVIMIAIDATGEKILLGRGKRYPGKFYSALAGFIEPGETFEDAVVREMWEEAGVKVWDVRYHSGQPWPYPANLMVGFYARADATKPIRTDLDNELIDARWYTRAEVQAVLAHAAGTKFGKADYKKMAENIENRVNVPTPTSTSGVVGGPTQTTSASAPQPGQVAQVNDNWTEVVKDAIQPQPAKEDEPAFRVPPTTAIAGILIKDWADGRVRFENEQVPQIGDSRL